MRKLLVIVIGVAAVAAAGWSGVWFVGRGQVADRIGQEISLLAEAGTEVRHGALEIGGFPFGYRVTLHDVTLRAAASGGVYHLPEITAEVSVADMDRLVIRMPETFRVDLPVPAGAGVLPFETPEVLVFDIEAADLVVVTDGLPGRGQEIAVTAQSLLVVTGGGDQRLSLAVEMNGIDSRAVLPMAASGIAATSSATIERLDYVYVAIAPSGATITFEGLADKLVLTGRSTIRDRAGLMALLAGGGGAMSFTYQTGASTAAIRKVQGAGQAGRTVVFAAGSTAGTLAVADSMVEIAASSRANTVALNLEGSGGEADKAGFGAALRSVEAIYQAPIAPSDAMAPFTLRLVLDEVEPDEALWDLIDAGEILPRDPTRLVADLEGSGRITKSLADMRPGEAMPVAFGNISVRALDLSMLGAGVATRGEVEFLQPINLPLGSLTVTMEKVVQTAAKLAKAGWLTPEQLQAAALLAATYARPGDAPSVLISDIAMSVEGITVNGIPVNVGQ